MITEAVVATVTFGITHYVARYSSREHPRPAVLLKQPWALTLIVVFCMLTFTVTCSPSTAGIATVSIFLGGFAAWNLGWASAFNQAIDEVEEYANSRRTPRHLKYKAPPSDIVNRKYF